MRLQFEIALPPSLLFAALCTVCGAQELIRVGNVQRMELVHRTAVTVPTDTEVLRVFHARPVPPNWRLPRDVQHLAELSFRPDKPIEEATTKEDGHWWKWEQRHPQPGVITFESRFVIATADRELQVDRLGAGWSDVKRLLPVVAPPEASLANSELSKLTQSLQSASRNPADAIQLATNWIEKNIEYSVAVRYPTTDLDSILRHRQGWCGHRSTVFQAMCRQMGIPVRAASGFLTLNKEGFWDGKGDWNRHTWAEVYLPKVGWVEVEPAAKNPFLIGDEYIKNPQELQSHAVWIRTNGKWEFYDGYKDTIRVSRLAPQGFRKPRVGDTYVGTWRQAQPPLSTWDVTLVVTAVRGVDVQVRIDFARQRHDGGRVDNVNLVHRSQGKIDGATLALECKQVNLTSFRDNIGWRFSVDLSGQNLTGAGFNLVRR